MTNNLFPFSGNVSQAINPWNWFNKVLGGQFGFVNINLGRSTDPELEHQILEEVGSYGRQLGQLGDVLEAVLAHMPTDTWGEEAKEAVTAFKLQMAAVKRLKAGRRRGKHWTARTSDMAATHSPG